MKYSEIVNYPSFQTIAAVLRIALRSTTWRQQHQDIPVSTLWNNLVDLPGGPQHADWLSRWTDLQQPLAEADANLVLSTADIDWLLSWQSRDPGESQAVMALLYAYAMAPDETVTPAEIAAVTGTAESTWRNKAAAGELPGAVKRGKQWLIPERVVLDAVLAGSVQPSESDTAGTIWYHQNKNEPLEEIGRMPGQAGMHILRKQDGSLTAIGGYWLRREGEVWSDLS